jgi:hypothetical protein
MSRERLSMRTIREVLRLSYQGLSQRSIASSCRVSATTVREYLYRAAAAGIVWPLQDGITDAALDRLLFPVLPASADARPVPDWSKVAIELRRKGVTFSFCGKSIARLLAWPLHRHVRRPDKVDYKQRRVQFDLQSGEDSGRERQHAGLQL